MAVTEYAPGKFRAYKKIRGRERQFYFASRCLAEKKQAELDSFARLLSRPVFSRCGRLKGFRVKIDRRRNTICVRVQILSEGRRVDTSIAYNGDFSCLWSDVYAAWKRLHQLNSRDAASYAEKVKDAKRLYFNDVIRSE
ncbi:hypothetical protein [uncultured Paraglaciecola sp.]|uniref:hypothetical protein n=1 Tax=uncultured Paraglaciecola sp. TaxID=1765024 RepID=UPI002618FB70|nr:hypothetical protein [uncultured Paraglaciecola sp.]